MSRAATNPSTLAAHDAGHAHPAARSRGDSLEGHSRLTIPSRPPLSPNPRPPTDGAVIETILGIEIADPFRSLEELGSHQTAEYMRQLNTQSRSYLHSDIPDLQTKRQSLKTLVTSNLSYARRGVPQLQANGWYYWLYNDGSFQRDIMVRSKDLKQYHSKTIGSLMEHKSATGAQVVYDPNAEENTSLYMYTWSPSGNLLNLILQKSGSDWQTIRTMDLASGTVIDELQFSKFTFGVSFVGEQGILYKRLLEIPTSDDYLTSPSNKFGYFYHHFNTDQSADICVWKDTNEYGHYVFAGRTKIISSNPADNSGSRAWLYIDLYKSTNAESENLLCEIPRGISKDSLAEACNEFPKLLRTGRKWLNRGWSGDMRYVGSLPDETALFHSTADGAKCGRVVSFTLSQWESYPLDQIIPPTVVVPSDPEGHVLRSAHLVDGKVLVLLYLRHACVAVVFVDAKTGLPIGATDQRGSRNAVIADGPIHPPVPNSEMLPAAAPPAKGPIMIPQHASINVVASRQDTNDFYLAIDTYVSKPYVLAGHVVDGSRGLEVDLHSLGDASEEQEQKSTVEDLVCKQVFYTSHDGTKVPMFISHRHDLDISKPQPTLVYAYGGYGAPVLPKYDPFFMSFMQACNGVLAVANIRGGGEYGKEWHRAAIGVKKHVAWDDFAWAMKYLHQQGVSTPALTATYGTSNGGLLVSATLLRHPELSGVVMPDVPVEDLIRFHKHSSGRMWIPEFGNPEDPAELAILAKSSPAHNVCADSAVVYPSVLITSGDHDTRVVPSHAMKFIAALHRNKPHNSNALLCRVYENAGHEPSSRSTKQRTEEIVDRLIFTLIAMGNV